MWLIRATQITSAILFIYLLGHLYSASSQGQQMRQTEITPAEVTTPVRGVTGGSKDGKLTPDAANEWRKTDSPNFFQINDHKSGNENVC